LTGGTLGPYQVHEQLGAGAMGEVYRATDPRLGRDVALKVLPESMAGDPQLVVRLEREARALAALNHPNIAAIHGIEESGGRLALVLELVEGETLETRLRRGPLPLDEGLAVAAQIAAALEAAHDRGIVHRDLKPANIKLRPDGAVKVLDFGIARFVGPDDAQGLGDGAAATRTGTVIGTPAYMSPEQLRGQAADARSDLWAFGCVLYEILTGTHTFAADTMSDVIARVIDTEPDWERVPPSTPRSVQRLLRRCLSKDRAARLRHAGDALLEINEAGSETTAAAGSSAKPGRWAMAAGGVVVMALVWALSSWLGGPPALGPTLPAAGLELGLSTQVPLDTDVIESRLARLVAISPDASRIVYVGQNGATSLLYERRLDDGASRPLEGTTGARAPFFSPAGGSVGFVVWDRLWTMRLDGGSPREVGSADSRNGAVWLPSGDIVASLDTVVTRYRRDGQVSPLVGDGADFALMRAPVLLPDGDHVLAGIRAAGSTNLDDPGELRIVSLADGSSRTLVERGSSPQFLPTPEGPADGYLLYASEGSIWAAPVRLPAVELLAPASPVVSDVMMRFNGDAAQYAVASDGTLVYLTGNPANELVWVTETGLVTAASRHLRPFAMPRLSPDGRRVALELHEGAHAIWVLDLDRDALTRVSYAARVHNFAWSPDSRALLFTRSDGDAEVIAWKRIGDPGDGELVLSLEGH
jgi:serine/threonine-protein kinase